MTKDECLKLVRDAAELAGASLRAEVDAQVLKAVLAEREACAVLVETEWSTDAEKAYGDELAAAIRARSNQ